MENIKNYDYRLFFGKNIKNPMTEVTEIPPLHAKQNFYIEIDKVKYSIVLSGLKFTRKVYEPGIIEAEVSIKSAETTGENVGKIPTFNQVEALLMDRQIELTIVDIDKFKAKPTGQNGEEQAQKTIDDKSETSIAKNYYVYMINPQIATNSGAKEMFVKLTIHSFDKLMDIDKYCKAYTAKKLAKDIITNELDTFGLPASLVSTEIANLQNLKYEDSTSTPTEKIQPYLVQYNETLLNFRYMNLCVKAEAASLIPVNVNIFGEDKDIEEVAEVAIQDDYHLAVFPKNDEYIRYITQGVINVHPEFKLSMKTMKVGAEERQYLEYEMPEVDKNRYDFLNEAVKSLYDEAKLKIDQVNTEEQAAYVQILSQKPEELDEVNKELDRMHDETLRNILGSRDDKLQEIEDGYLRYLSQRSNQEGGDDNPDYDVTHSIVMHE